MLYDVKKVLQECNAVTWFNKDVIKVLQGTSYNHHRIISSYNKAAAKVFQECNMV